MPKLDKYSVHIFISDSGNIRFEKGFLTEQEKEYAVSISQNSGNQYLGGRWLVRKALTFLLGGNDSMWVFDPKHPFLKLQNRPDPYISMSHSGSFIGSSICLHPCGLDLQVHVDKNFLGIAETFFCESEYDMLHQLAPDKRAEQFFRLWTLKEAWSKVPGESFLDTLGSVSFLPGESLREGYNAWHINLKTDLSTAVIVCGRLDNLMLWQYNGDGFVEWPIEQKTFERLP